MNEAHKSFSIIWSYTQRYSPCQLCISKCHEALMTVAVFITHPKTTHQTITRLALISGKPFRVFVNRRREQYGCRFRADVTENMVELQMSRHVLLISLSRTHYRTNTFHFRMSLTAETLLQKL